MNINELRSKVIDINQKAKALIENADMTSDDAQTVERMLRV